AAQPRRAGRRARGCRGRSIRNAAPPRRQTPAPRPQTAACGPPGAGAAPPRSPPSRRGARPTFPPHRPTPPPTPPPPSPPRPGAGFPPAEVAPVVARHRHARLLHPLAHVPMSVTHSLRGKGPRDPAGFVGAGGQDVAPLEDAARVAHGAAVNLISCAPFHNT